MQAIRLKRTCRDDLVFTGVLLSSVDEQDRCETSFSGINISLYQTSTKAYILGITLHRYCSLGHENFSSTVAFDSIDDILDFMCHEECQDISLLVEILLKKANQTIKSLKKKNYLETHPQFTSQKQRKTSDFATALRL
ncbi:hypothetical protein SAMN06295888_11789 [Desulfonatronum zhilinae]|nr:hypothetical protein SAMN06295888_11789 [Desulfonatronum zhilinae]